MKAALLNNRYRILETIGRGGFGETYLAEDTHMPSQRKCVLKQLKPIVEQPHLPEWVKERFQREAAILEELGDGNRQIPCLYAYFSEADKFYLVQEWIEGVTLAEKWQNEGNLDAREVRQILVQLLPVLDFVHSKRIIHRDIKPENIIIRYQDNLPVLIDFGAVKEAIATVVNTNNSSAFSAAIGTPGYMPSEQAAGRPVYSSDLYSLGLTAIFLLTGKSPQDLQSDPGTGEIIWQEYASNIDPKLVAILTQAIKFHPRDRFTTAREMLEALDSSVPWQNLTKKTLVVAPKQGTNQNNYHIPRQKGNTAAVKVDSFEEKKSDNWLVNLFLFLLLAGGLSVGAFVVGFSFLSNIWNNRSQPLPQATLEEPTEQTESFPAIKTFPELVKPNKPKVKPKAENQTKSELEANNSLEESEPESELESEPPEVVIDTKTEPEPQPEPQPEINVPIIRTGSSENQLVSTLGKPTSERQDWQKDSRTLVYQDIVPNQVNLSYKSDGTGKIRQTDIALASSISLDAMQETLNELLGGNAPSDVTEKLRQVYSRETKFSFFKVDNLEGKVERDSKDRITISVWESGYE
ncbi:serine/threonine protein kinase [Stanieria cyanosphaera PCC 7437]|uniref:non-specific serine/threonine protein kinase n=1 Tax=Stanieria cyanosphaera (strain ATCC 29371 / PCC 7437) TaxID=111780 RepID=K9XWB9_STAC7|nr:serine/threonine-protein kinase [Stanieria cyanosphaera]AFZ36833.1 serine/threonine protein kinase [Stanieria cyanosphaera PCC 7437]